MGDEVFNLWIPINRFDSDSCFATFDLATAKSSSDPSQSLKEEESEKKYKDSCFEVLLDNRSKFGDSTIGSTERSEKRNSSVLSDFIGAECGEPFVPQCLVFDFTPRPGDEALSLKCSKFWNYVNSRPDLSQYKVYPSVSVTPEYSNTTTSEELNSKENEDQNTTTLAPDTTKAIKWLAKTSKGNTPMLTEKTFPAVKPCRKYCDTYGSYQGVSDDPASETGRSGISARREKSIHGSIDLEPTRSSQWTFKSDAALKYKTRPQTRQVKALCEEMASFDEAHPRNFDPPLHLSVQRAVLRKITI